MLVYHTSDTIINSPDTFHSRDALDFGRGFYVTKLKEQAIKYAERFTKVGKAAYLHIYEYTPILDFKIKVLNSYNEEWLDFVCNCRRGSNIYREFDIIEGGVANDKVFQTVDLYMAGIYTTDQALQRLVYEKPNHQICFVSQEALDKCLKRLEYNVI